MWIVKLFHSVPKPQKVRSVDQDQLEDDSLQKVHMPPLPSTVLIVSTIGTLLELYCDFTIAFTITS